MLRAFFVASVAGIAALSLALPARAQFVPVAPGVELLKRTDPGPNRVRALRINLCRSGVRMRATATGERKKKTSSWGASAGVVAAVNGGFFTGSYAPDQGVAVGAGNEWPDSKDSGVRGYIGFGSRKLLHSSSPEVLSPAAWIEEAVNGDATLVMGGKAVNCGGCGGNQRHPRTAVGTTKDGKTVYLVTVDGRTQSSIGLTIDQLAVLMAGFGVDRAMNLDGGGSTAMWVKGQGVVNVPSDGPERVVANHLGVFAAGSGVTHNCPTGFSASLSASGFPGEFAITMPAGSTLTAYFDLENTGTETWTTGKTRLAPTPRDKPSVLAAADWIAPHRIGGPDSDTPAGKTGRFSFTLAAPDKPGTYKQTFSVVEEGVTWFADSYGPADDTFSFTVTVTEAVPGSGGAGGAGQGGSSAQGGGAGGSNGGIPGQPGGAAGSTSSGQKTAVMAGDSEGSCGCRTVRRPQRSSLGLLPGALLLLLLRRRRLRTAWLRSGRWAQRAAPAPSSVKRSANPTAR